MARLALAAALLLAIASPARAETIDVPSNAHMTIVGEHGGAGSDVAGAGDVNGDGIPDVVVADDETDGTTPSAAYVVFGRRTPSTVQLASLGSSGFKIRGAARIYAVAGAGDVNADGLADVLIADATASFNGRDQSGSAYVVFGKSTTTPVDVTALGQGGFRIDGPVALENTALFPAIAVDGARDVNGDGRDDVVVGFEQVLCVAFGMVCDDRAGKAFVVFGRTGGGAVDTAALGSSGYLIAGTPVGAQVAGVGDFNGDSIPDVAVSRQYDDAGWVVFGRRPAANVDLTALGSGGFKITDSSPASVAWSLAGLGDVNGDRRPDLLVASGPEGQVAQVQARAAAIFGGPSTSSVDLASLGSRGFLVTGDTSLGRANAAGDVNRDGRGDLLGELDGNPPPRPTLAAVFGRASTSTVDVTALGSQGPYLSSPRSSGSFAGAGDITGDHAADVVIGAEDNGGAVGHAYVASLRPTALRRLNELRFQIAGFGLPDRLRDRFFLRLDRVQAAYLGANQPAACSRLDRVSGLAMRRLAAGRLTAAQGYAIVAGVARVKDAAGCG